MSAKVLVGGISIVLVVVVIIGVVMTVHYPHYKRKFSVDLKTVSVFCSSTAYQETCYKTLYSANSTDPKVLIAKAISDAEEAVKEFSHYSDSLIVQGHDNSLTNMALDDCKEMMNYAADSLRASYSDVNDGDIDDIDQRVNDIRTWLSAAISYQQSCLDGLEHDITMKETVDKGIVEARELTSNALTIVTYSVDILSKFEMNLDNDNGRKLVSDENNGYSSWFSVKNRHLLTRIGNGSFKPDAIVAQDGTGQFKTIGAALAAALKRSNVRHVIYIKSGIYEECVTVDKEHTNILMYGDGPTKTIVTGRKGAKDGITSWRTATFAAIGNGFIAKSMGFKNTAGPKQNQAVALRVQSDKSAFFNCRMDGYQDTLFNQANRQFFRNCVISGTIDFIFGDSPTIIQNSVIIVRSTTDNPFYTVTAQGKVHVDENTGIVIQNCRIVPEQKLFNDRFRVAAYLGRPWRKFSTAIIMESALADFIRPEGWLCFHGPDKIDETIYYGEYNNRGPGADINGRVKWKGYHKIDRATAMNFTVRSFLYSKEDWVPLTRIPFTGELNQRH